MKFILRSSGVLALVAVICLLLAVTAGCSSPTNSAQYADNPIAERETLTQVSTINALMAGVYDGVISCGQLRDYGDFGIGTFDALDAVADSLGVPFATVTYFDCDHKSTIASGIDYSGFQAILDEIIPSGNIFFAVKIDGNFSYVNTRSVPRQEKPYPVLSDATRNQSVFEFTNVSGTMVGFRCPQYVIGVNVPGYHLHFLTTERKAGGHVLDFTIKQATASVDYTSKFLMILPGKESDFYKLDLSGDNREELEKVEK